ncbi:MAG: Dabb family protein [Pirellulaceae bacterium]|jgi:quinol monooxygenase YgiN|nr:Dabb family protein [Pirellulaceae bacterium]MDP7014742.1 Dabb family protein [Pirellulaceae bacterium]
MTDRPMLAHMVYFTLTDPSEGAIQELIASCKEHLSSHPGTVLFAVGRLTADLNRPVNDRDFHVALQLVFESREAHDVYQVSDRHQQFIAKNKESWAQVRVFDADVTN